jgi:predicted HicB family RNase H-like nuclease
MSNKPQEKYPSEKLPKFMVRFPPALKAWLAEQAKKNRRSQSAELIHRLEHARNKEQCEAAQP